MPETTPLEIPSLPPEIAVTSRLGHGWLWPAIQRATLGLAILTVAGFMGQLYWLVDLSAHFRFQYAWLLVLVLVPLLAGRLYKWAALAGAALFINLAALAPLWTTTPAASLPGAKPLKIIVFNVFMGLGPTREQRTDYLARSGADVLIILEASASWGDQFERLAEAYPYSAHKLLPATHGIAVLSTIPADSLRVLDLDDAEFPAVEMRFPWEGRIISLLAIHPPPPITGQLSRSRDQLLAAAAGWAKSRNTPAIIAGDFNDTPWGASFRKLLKTTGLINSLNGFGYESSWCDVCGPLRLPIDHVLYSPELTTVSRQLGPRWGSDHDPVETELAWAR